MEILDLIAKVSYESDEKTLQAISNEHTKQSKLLDELRTKGMRLNEQMVKTNDPKKIKAINDELQKTRKQVESITSAQQKQADMTTKLRDRQKELVKELQKANDPKAVQGLLRSLHQVDNQLSALTTKTKDLGSKFSGMGQSLLAGFGLGAGAFGLSTAMSAISGFVSASIGEFEDAQKTAINLERTLKVIGKGGLFDGIMDEASALAEQFHGLFDNDEIVQAQTALVNYGKVTREEMSKLMPVILNLASAEGIDLATATEKVIGILEGRGGATLREYGLSVKGVKSEHDRLNLVLGEFGSKLSGASDAYAQTAEGIAKINGNMIADIEERFGASLSKIKEKTLPIITSLLNDISETFNNVSDNWFTGLVGMINPAFGAQMANERLMKEAKFKDALPKAAAVADTGKINPNAQSPEEIAAAEDAKKAQEEAAKKAAEERAKRIAAQAKIVSDALISMLAQQAQDEANLAKEHEATMKEMIGASALDKEIVEVAYQNKLKAIRDKYARVFYAGLQDQADKEAVLKAEADKKKLDQERKTQQHMLDIINKTTKDAEEDRDRKQKKRDEARKKEQEDLQDLSNNTFDLANQLSNAYQIEIDSLDRLISKQQERVDAAKESSEASLKIEQRRLDELTSKRTKYERQQRALDATVMLANQAMAFSNAIVGVSAAVKSGNAVLILANIAAVLGSLVGGYAAVRGLSNQSKGFKEGGYTGDGDPSDESNALGNRGYKYHRKEFVMNESLTEKHRDMFEGMHRGRLIAKKMGNSWVLMPKGIDVDAAVADHHSVRAEYNTASMENILYSIDRRLQHREVRVENNFDAEGFSTNIAAKLGRISIIDKMRNS